MEIPEVVVIHGNDVGEISKVCTVYLPPAVIDWYPMFLGTVKGTVVGKLTNVKI
jgi:hypothetical protein